MCHYNILFTCNYTGYIGSGMLSAAVAGAVFTSPPPSSILAALRTISKPGAGLLSKFTCSIVTCYTCTKWVLNFDFNHYRNSILVTIKLNWYNDSICIKQLVR